MRKKSSSFVCFYSDDHKIKTKTTRRIDGKQIEFSRPEVTRDRGGKKKEGGENRTLRATHEVSGLNAYATENRSKLPPKPYSIRPSQPSFSGFSPGLTPNNQPVGGSY